MNTVTLHFFKIMSIETSLVNRFPLPFQCCTLHGKRFFVTVVLENQTEKGAVEKMKQQGDPGNNFVYFFFESPPCNLGRKAVFFGRNVLIACNIK